MKRLHVTKVRRWVAAGLVTLACLTGAAAAYASVNTGLYTDPNAYGTLTFYDATGKQITSGSTTTAPFVKYAVASQPPDVVVSPNTATLYFYPVNPSEPVPANWSGIQLGSATQYPNASAPAPINSNPNPVNTGGTADYTIADAASAFPSPASAQGTPSQDVYQIRMKTRSSINWQIADIKITGTTWTQIFPAGSTPTTTTSTTTAPTTSTTTVPTTTTSTTTAPTTSSTTSRSTSPTTSTTSRPPSSTTSAPTTSATTSSTTESTSATTSSTSTGTTSGTGTTSTTGTSTTTGMTSATGTSSTTSAPTATATAADGTMLAPGDTLTPGETVTIAGAGFTAGESVAAILASTPKTVGTVTATADGKASYDFVVPADLAAGAHTLTLQGATTSAVFPFAIAAAGGSTATSTGVSPSDTGFGSAGGVGSGSGSGLGALPRTGQESVPLVAGGLLLLFVGGVGLLVARRLRLESGTHL